VIGPVIGYWMPTGRYLEQLVAIAHVWEGWRGVSVYDQAAALRVALVVHGPPPPDRAARAV
jgi:hypothetical protein